MTNPLLNGVDTSVFGGGSAETPSPNTNSIPEGRFTRFREAAEAQKETVNIPRIKPPKPNTISSLDKSDTEAVEANPLMKGVDSSVFKSEQENVDDILSRYAAPTESPSIWKSINETMLNLAALVPTADVYNYSGTGAIRRERFLNQLAAVPDGHFKNAVFKTFNDFINTAKSISEWTPVGLAANGGAAAKSKQFRESLGKVGGGIKDLAVGGTKSVASRGFVGGSEEIAGHVFDMVVTQTIKNVFGAGTGLDISNNFEVMTPEQRAADMKMSAAIVTLGLGAKGINSAFGEGLTEVPLLSSGKTIEVAGRTVGKRFGIGVVEGAVGGTIFGTIARAGDPDQLSGVITDALMFGSFGSTLNMLVGKRPKLDVDNVAYAARLLQLNENSSLGQAVAKPQAILTSQNIVEAAIKGQVVLDPTRAHIFTGLKNGREIMDALGKGAHIRSNGKGGWDLLFIGDDLRNSIEKGEAKLDIEMWHSTGFMSGQTVSIGGQEYKVVGHGSTNIDGPQIKLQDKGGIEIEMPANALRNIPGSEFRGRNQAPAPNTLFSGVAYRGTRNNIGPLEPGHVGATFMSEDPVFATIHSEKGGAVHRIEYNFKNPKQIPEPTDINTRQQYLKDEIRKAYEEGHDGLFIGELGSERLEIIDVTNDKKGLSVKERVDRSMMDMDDIDFYFREIKPRMEDGMTFHEAILDALGLTAEEVARVKGVPEEDLAARYRVKTERGFEKVTQEPIAEKVKEPVVDNRTESIKAKYSGLSDLQVLQDIENVKDNINRLEQHGSSAMLSIRDTDIYSLRHRLRELEQEASIRDISEQSIIDRYKDLNTEELQNLYTIGQKGIDDLHRLMNEAAKDITDTNNLLEKQAEITDQYKDLLRKNAELEFVLDKRTRTGTGSMIEFKRRSNSALKDTKVLDENGNAKIVYHGTGIAFPEFKEEFLNPRSLKGPGFYFTEDPRTASGYAETGVIGHDTRDQVIQMHQAEIEKFKEELAKNPHKKEFIDGQIRHLEQEIEYLKNIAPNIHRVKLDIKNPFDTDKLYSPEETIAILERLGVDRKLFFEQNHELPGGGLTGDQILDEIRSAADDSEIPDVLQEAGYDGITHIGGSITGNKPHRVWIAFDESQVHPIDADLVKIERRSLDYTPPKAGIDAVATAMSVKLAKRMELIHNLVGQSSDPYAMVQVAGTNGFTIENPANSGGMIVLRDAESGIPIGSFTSAEKAREFINDSGQAHGIDLTDGGGPNDPPPIGPEGIMPPDGPPPSPNPAKLSPFHFGEPGKLELKYAALNEALPWLAMKRTYYTALDKLHNTQFFSKVYQPTQVAALKALAVTRELMVPLSKIEKKAKGLNLERRAVIARYRQTMSPDEIMVGLFDRPLNNNEIALAKHFAGAQDGIAVNIDAVYDYLRDAKKLNDEYTKLINQLEGEAQVAGQQLEPERIQQQLDKKEAEILQLQELHGLSAKDLEAAKDFELIKRQNLNEMSLYGITELAKAIVEDRPTRAKFAEENKMTAKELEIAEDFDNLFSTLADVFGIDRTRRINGFMNHYRRYGEMPHVPVEKPLAGRKSATKFLSDLIRSGEIYDYIDDPFHAAAAYIRSGVNGKVLNQVWADARIAAKGEIARMPAAARQQATNVIDEYFNEIKGIPGAADNAMQSAFDTYMQRIGVSTTRKVRRDIVNGILSTIGSSLLGFKPELGLRDIGSWFGIHGSRFGYTRALRALRYAFEKDENGISVADRMLREGHFPGLSPIGVQSASELAALEHGPGIAGRIAKFGETVGEAGLRVSLQKNFYAKMHAGAYLEASRRATRLLQDFREGRISRERAYSRLDMHSYENPVAQHFDDLVVNGKDQEAAHYLGLATAVETNFFHGLSNHPYKWGTNVGRIAGQFGQWSMFSRDYLVRLASRGTKAQRAAAIGRFALNYTAINGIGRLLGFNMRAWQILPGLVFTGGPMVQVLGDNIAMTGAMGSRKQKEAIGMFWNQHTSLKGFRSMFGPGTYAFHDVMEAWAANKDGYGLIPVVGRGFGFKIDHTQRSFLDEFLGNYPVVHQEKPLTTFLADKVDKTFR